MKRLTRQQLEALPENELVAYQEREMAHQMRQHHAMSMCDNWAPLIALVFVALTAYFLFR